MNLDKTETAKQMSGLVKVIEHSFPISALYLNESTHLLSNHTDRLFTCGFVVWELRLDFQTSVRCFKLVRYCLKRSTFMSNDIARISHSSIIYSRARSRHISFMHLPV